ESGRAPPPGRRRGRRPALRAGRPRGPAPAPARLGGWRAGRERAAPDPPRGPVAARHAGELLDTFSLERGRYNGAPVTEGTLDIVQNRRDEALLRRFAARLPDPDLRRQALRRIIRLHIAASTYPQPRTHARPVH